MFKKIMMPIDLGHKEKYATAVAVAADQAKHYGAELALVSISGGTQSGVSYSDSKYAAQLEEFAANLAAERGVTVTSKVVHVADPGAELDRTLLHLIEETKADLAVIGSHQPGWSDYIVNSHGGRLASHAPISVFVVREKH